MKKEILLVPMAALLLVQASRGQNVQAVYRTLGNPAGIEGFSSQVVVGRPFSAAEERHSLQVLVDGTRIESTETNHLYRDSQGRTRVERTGGNITIFDPIAGFTAELNPSAKTATRNNTAVPGLRRVLTTSAVADIRAKLDALRRQLQTSTSAADAAKISSEISDLEKKLSEPAAPGQLFLFSPAVTSFTPTGGTTTFNPGGLTQVLPANGRTRVFYFSADHQVPTMDTEGTGNNWSLENLSPQSINGVQAQGTRTTETIPTGKIGNDRPIAIVNERWTSSDLQMLIKSTSSDPRFGDTTYQLTNIVQSSPDPALFQIPSDYTVTSPMAPIPVTRAPNCAPNCK